MKNESLSESVYQYLLDQILSMQIKPGDRVPEAKIASEFGISRTPIREVLRRLANDGIINIYPNRFAEVARWDDETMRQVGMVRVQLDLLAVKLAVYHASNADFIQMFQHSLLCLAAADKDDVATRIREDCAFHWELSNVSKNKQLAEFSRNIYLKIEFLQSWRGVFIENPREQHRQHEEIFHTLMDRDECKASELIAKHHIHFHDLEQYYPVEWFLHGGVAPIGLTNRG